MKKHGYILGLSVSIVLGVFIHCVEAGPTVNYQGRITAGGGNYTGQGFFKFVLRNGDMEGLWANDGSPGIGEPAASETIEVNNGLFNVELGEDMNTIPPLVFHGNELYLRTWFSTNNVTFEQLAPDVRIYPMNFAHIDTGDMIVVDSEGKADFADIQSAIDHAATSDWNTAIILMPGWYDLSSPLALPTNKTILLRGAGAHSFDLEIHNHTGPTVLMEPGTDLRIANLSLSGSTAVADSGSGDGYRFSARNCDIGNWDEGIAEWPIDLNSENGSVLLTECNVVNDYAGGAVRLSGGVRLVATETSFSSQDESNNTLRIEGDAECDLRGCTIDGPGTGPGTAATVYMNGTDVHARFSNTDVQCNEGGVSLAVSGTSCGGNFFHCMLESHTRIDALELAPEFVDCQFRSMELIGGAGSDWIFRNCHFNGEGTNRTVSIVGRESGTKLDNCYIFSTSNTAFYVEDATGGTEVRNSRIFANDASAVEVVASENPGAEQEVDVKFRDCQIQVGESENVDDKDAIVLNNHPNNSEDDVMVDVELFGCNVYGGIRDAIHSVGGESELGVYNCNEIQGYRNGIKTDWGGYDVYASGIYVESGAGIHAASSASLRILNSSIDAGEMNAKGIYLNLTGPGAMCMIEGSTVTSESGVALDVQGGPIVAGNSRFASTGTNSAVRLSTTNTIACFNHCTIGWLDVGDGPASSSPAIELHGPTGNTPVPRIIDSCIEAPLHATYAIDLGGGATTGNVVMVNSVLTTNINPNIGKVAPISQDAYGNRIAPYQP